MTVRASQERSSAAICAAATAILLLTLSLPRLPAILPGQTSMLTVHLLSELFAVVIAVMVVTVSWHTFRLQPNNPANVLVAGFTIVATCDLVHALTYAGMPPFLGPSSTDRAIFFWLMGRTGEIATLGLIALGRLPSGSRSGSLAVGLVVSALVVWIGSYQLALFPQTFVAGAGVTTFKAHYEIALCAANVLVAVLLWRRGRRTGEGRFFVLAASSWIIGIGELSFTGYVDPSDFLNIFGHAYKIAGYALLYRVTYLTGIAAPYAALSASERVAREGAARLRSLSNNLPHSAVYQVVREDDGQMRFVYVGDAVERILGVAPAAALSDFNALFHQLHVDDRPMLLAARQQSAERLTTFDVELRHHHRDGRLLWVHFMASPRRLDDGRMCWDGVMTEITERRLAELSRRENEAMLSAVVRSASDAVISTDTAGRITLFNPAAERIFGRSSSSVIGRSLDLLLPERVGSRHSADIASFAASGISSRRMGTGRVHGLRADGAELELEASISQVTVGERQVLTAFLRDVTDRVRTERAIVQYQLELTELTQRLMAQEKETTSRLAQALHDQLGQTLTAMRIDFVRDGVFADAARNARHARVDGLIDQAIREVRLALMQLRPTLLDERGLVEALDNELRTPGMAADGVRIQLDAEGNVAGQRWNADVEYAAFMVAREAIVNAMRHANATLVRVIVRGTPDLLHLEVVDSGVGFNPRASLPRPGHLGMVGMRERSISIGAQFEVQSAPGGGTAVRLTWQRTGT